MARQKRFGKPSTREANEAAEAERPLSVHLGESALAAEGGHTDAHVAKILRRMGITGGPGRWVKKSTGQKVNVSLSIPYTPPARRGRAAPKRKRKAAPKGRSSIEVIPGFVGTFSGRKKR